ncbi:MAG TPA: hypothetical protein VN541_15200, partial [Tepidisphaeraceae bacterium]|nr:hypothetical protein [Tepidisphaeraceae bacterium]
MNLRQSPPLGRRSILRRLLKITIWLGGGALVLLLILVGVAFLLLHEVPRHYTAAVNPIGPPPQVSDADLASDGFASPYLGHTGSWDGKGGGMWGSSKIPDLDREVAMGLRWTFMAVNWSAMEPDGPVDLSKGVPPAWSELDGFLTEAHKRRLNVLMQIVIGGNAGGPPKWAGRREAGKSAPTNMPAAAAFAGKLAERYAPGGSLGTKLGWPPHDGVRAWELDNEPESYRTCWKGQAGDYAEFATRAAARIKQFDPHAVIVLPATAGGTHALPWIEAALDAHGMPGSPIYRQRNVPYSIGPVADVVSFHCYEGLETAFTGSDRTIVDDFLDVRTAFEKWESRSDGFHFVRKQEYWHTEGNFDFLGILSAKRRAAWRMQFFTRAFAAGIRKVCVMDPSEPERIAVKAYIHALPWPFPMKLADDQVTVTAGRAT